MPDVPASTRPLYQGPVVVRPRQDRRPDPLAVLDLLSYLMDRCFTLPGTHVRFGVNSLMLLVPVLGDLLASLVSFTILAIGLSNHRVPRIVTARLLLNSTLDALLSGIPLIGNVWDVYFKADTRNVKLLRQYVGDGEPPPSTWRHWAFVLSVLGLFVALLALAALGAVTLVSALVRHFQASGAA